jgi:hypothetical protein
MCEQCFTGVQAFVDLKAVHAISDVWINLHSGNAWLTIELFLDSPFDRNAVHTIVVNTSQTNGKPVAEPPVSI